MGLEGLQSIYTNLRTTTFRNRVVVTSMAIAPRPLPSGDTRVYVEFTEHLRFRVLPLSDFSIRFIALFDVRQDRDDGLWRISRYEDNVPSDVYRSGVYLPGMALLSNLLKSAVAWYAIVTGALVARTGILG